MEKKCGNCPHCDKHSVDLNKHKCSPDRVIRSKVSGTENHHSGIYINILTIGGCPDGDYIVVARYTSAFGIGEETVEGVGDRRFDNFNDAWEYYRNCPEVMV